MLSIEATPSSVAAKMKFCVVVCPSVRLQAAALTPTVCLQEAEEDLAESEEYKEARTMLDSVKLDE